MDIKDLMNTDFQSCLSTTTLNEVRRMLKRSAHNAVVVLDQNKLPLGVITERDIDEVYSYSDTRDADFLASDVVKNKEIYNCWDGDNIQIAASMINDRGLSFLPVVNSDFCFVGVMTASNSLASLDNIMPYHSRSVANKY
ncbi:MAG: CBS domain-containing protein [Gammaproteobacteria bacterium]|nr:CBS domain-containing protein [Gammaproteobacteria bacterium]